MCFSFIGVSFLCLLQQAAFRFQSSRKGTPTYFLFPHLLIVTRSIPTHIRAYIWFPLLRLLARGCRCTWPTDNSLLEKRSMAVVVGHRRSGASQRRTSLGLVALLSRLDRSP